MTDAMLQQYLGVANMSTKEKDEQVAFDIANELGYLRASVERLAKTLEDHMILEERDREIITSKLKKLEDARLIQTGMLKLLSIIGAIAWALLTFKFSSIRELWHLLNQ